MYNKDDIKAVIPHREPMLMVDAILSMDENEVHGQKIANEDDLYFKGHFPGNPVMPGVFILEALAQTGAFALMSREAYKGKTGYFAKITEAKFKRKILPNDTIDLKVKVDKIRGSIVMASGIAYVEGEKACEASFTFAMGD